MALDFSKFVLPSPDVSWVSKLPEYSALGDKTAEKEKGSLSSVYNILNANKFKVNPKIPLQEQQQAEINTSLQQGIDKIKEGNDAGLSNDALIYQAMSFANSIATNVNRINQLVPAYEQMEKMAKETPGMNLDRMNQSFNKYFLYNEDGTPKKVTDILSGKDGEALTHVSDFLNSSEDIYDTEGFKKALKDANPNSTTQKFNKRDKAGNVTEYYSSTKVPSNLYKFIETDEGDKPVIDGERTNISNNDVVSLMHEQLKDNETGADINIIPQSKLDSYENNFPGIKGYIDQEKRKFAKAAEAKGLKIKDDNGQYTLEFQQQMDDYGRAVAYKKFDELGQVMGGFSTTGGQPGKKDIVAQKAPPPKRPGLTINVGQKETFVTNDRFQKALDAKPKDADGFIDIKNQVSGLNDDLSLKYGYYQSVKLGRKDGNWVIRIIDGDNNLKEMSFDEFYSIAPSQDPKDKRASVLLNLDAWIKKQPKSRL